MHFVYGFCGGNACAAVGEYQRHFPEWRNLAKGVFARVYQTIHETLVVFQVSVCSLKGKWYLTLTHERTILRWFRVVQNFPLLELHLPLMCCICRWGELYKIRGFSILNQETLPNIWICTAG
jgi:hypothetical protein